MQRDLVQRAQRGDREAFGALAEQSIGRLYDVAQLMLHDSDLAKDAVQEALILAWRDLRALRDPDRFTAWMHRILVRFALIEWSPDGRAILSLPKTLIDIPRTRTGQAPWHVR